MSDITTTPAPTSNTQPPVAVVLPPSTFPYLSCGLVGVLIVVFVLELLFQVDSSSKLLEPSIKTLVAFGGLQYSLVFNGSQWWRIFTGPLLHANPLHLGLNCLTLVIAGAVLERIVGRLWFAAAFVVGALGGAVGSLLFNPHNLVSVGASGAIMGTFATILVVSFRYALPQIRNALIGRALQVLIPSLIPFANVGHEGKIDYGAHLGGAVFGAIFAWVLLVIMNLDHETYVLPRYRRAAAIIAALGLIGAMIGAIESTMNYRSAQAAMLLMPPQALPKTDADIHESSATWYVDKYPGDPRSYFFKALFFMKKPDFPAAEKELRTALAQKEVMERFLPPAFRLTVLGTLALAQSGEHHLDEARETATAVCKDPSSSMFDKVNSAGLCAGSSK